MEKESLNKKIRNLCFKEFQIWVEFVGVTGKKHSKNDKFHEFTYMHEGKKYRSYFTYLDVAETKIFIVWQQEEVK